MESNVTLQGMKEFARKRLAEIKNEADVIQRFLAAVNGGAPGPLFTGTPDPAVPAPAPVPARGTETRARPRPSRHAADGEMEVAVTKSLKALAYRQPVLTSRLVVHLIKHNRPPSLERRRISRKSWTKRVLSQLWRMMRDGKVTVHKVAGTNERAWSLK